MSDPVLELIDVRKAYEVGSTQVEVVRGIHVQVSKGEYVAISGPSGSGKSTLLNILGCLDRPTSGVFQFAGDDVSLLDDRALSHIRNTRLGFVFQSFHLVSHLSVFENVELPLFYARLPRKIRRSKARELVDRVGLGHRGNHIPNQLSGGEKQRAAIARALSNNPDLLLADEPTGNLDSVNSLEILKILDGLHEQGRTIVMITHDLEIARSAPRRIALRDGLVESDSMAGEAA